MSKVIVRLSNGNWVDVAMDYPGFENLLKQFGHWMSDWIKIGTHFILRASLIESIEYKEENNAAN